MFANAGINAKGVFFTMEKAIPLMDKRGSIILNGSFVGSSGFRGMSTERPKLPLEASRVPSRRS